MNKKITMGLVLALSGGGMADRAVADMSSMLPLMLMMNSGGTGGGMSSMLPMLMMMGGKDGKSGGDSMMPLMLMMMMGNNGGSGGGMSSMLPMLMLMGGGSEGASAGTLPDELAGLDDSSATKVLSRLLLKESSRILKELGSIKMFSLMSMMNGNKTTTTTAAAPTTGYTTQVVNGQPVQVPVTTTVPTTTMPAAPAGYAYNASGQLVPMTTQAPQQQTSSLASLLRR